MSNEGLFLVCEENDGGMMCWESRLSEVLEYLTTDRYAVPGEVDEMVPWLASAMVGEYSEYSKGVIVRLRDEAEP